MTEFESPSLCAMRDRFPDFTLPTTKPGNPVMITASRYATPLPAMILRRVIEIEHARFCVGATTKIAQIRLGQEDSNLVGEHRAKTVQQLLTMIFNNLKNSFVSAAALLILAGTAVPVLAAPVKNIVVVHGAFADGSGWKPVYDILIKDGYSVTIVQEPLTSLEEDVAMFFYLNNVS